MTDDHDTVYVVTDKTGDLDTHTVYEDEEEAMEESKEGHWRDHSLSSADFVRSDDD